MPKAISLSFSAPDFFSSSNSNIFHFRPATFFSKNLSKSEILSSFDRKTAELRAVFATADPVSYKPREIPDHLVDMITFEPMHDPVMTKNGHSYERAIIHEHLKRSPTDPLTREPLTIGQLRNNFGLRAACEEFWASGASEWIGDW